MRQELRAPRATFDTQTIIWNVKLVPIALLLSITTAFSQCLAQTPPASGQNRAAASPSEIEVIACVDRYAGKFRLTDGFWGVMYDLNGRTAELQSLIGDEVKVHGIEIQPPVNSTEHHQPGILQVTGVEVLLRVNPKGIRPLLGGLDTWPSYSNAEYGVRLRYPATFVGNAKWEYATMQSNFAGQEPPSSVQLFSASIPRNVYPDSNFVDGGFAVWLDTHIHAAGTCRQFREFAPQYTSSMTVAGTDYAYTSTGFVALATAASAYTFHTFHNGLCYEFAFAFAEADGTGIDLKCATQWMSEDNSFELMKAVLSQVSFSTPEFKAVPVASPNQGQVPAVVSFEHSPLDFNGISLSLIHI